MDRTLLGLDLKLEVCDQQLEILDLYGFYQQLGVLDPNLEDLDLTPKGQDTLFVVLCPNPLNLGPNLQTLDLKLEGLDQHP